jgi:hypothetical protein
VAAWRRDYNEHRPHSAIGYQTPAESATQHRANSSDIEWHYRRGQVIREAAWERGKLVSYDYTPAYSTEK